MKKMFYLTGTVLMCTFSIMSCTNSKKTSVNENHEVDSTQVMDMHNAETSLDYFGIYKGTIPAADCPGIRVTIVLNKDKTFTQQYLYIDRKDNEFNDSGTFEISRNLLTTTDKEGEKSYYKVEEGRIVMLDNDKQVIKGDLADMYVLKQEKVF